MALSDVALASRALIRLGAAPISSFEDETTEAQVSGALFASVRDALLSAYGWSFATGQIALSKLETPPVADYQNAFQLPNDFLRALSAGTGTRGRGVPYRIARGELHSDADSIVLTYIFRPEEETFPPYFDQVLISRLSAEFAIPITGSASRAETLYRLATQDFAHARQIDAQQDTPNRIESFSLIDARG